MKAGKGSDGRGGFTLVELMVAIALLLVSSVAVGLALHAGMRATRELQEDQVIQARAQTFVDRIVRQNFGQTFDADPTASQIDDIFNCTSSPGDVSLNQLTRWPVASGGWRFKLAGFPVDGEWLVVVDQDLNRDGSISGSLEEGKRVYSIRIFFRDRLILETSRAKEVTL